MPHKPAEYDKEIIMACRAFNEGKANEGQQLLVRDWLLHAVCQVDGMSYRPGGEDGRRASDFAEGKRYVANTFRKMLHPLTLKALEEGIKRRGKRQEAT